METAEYLASTISALEAEDLLHLQRLVAQWAMLADLSFSDLLALAPLREETPKKQRRFVVLGQVRPSTTQTVLEEDLIGTIFAPSRQAGLSEAFDTGEPTQSEERTKAPSERIDVQCIPLRRGDRVIAVVLRHHAPLVRRHGQLERTYVDLFDSFARMLCEGTFPYPDDEPSPAEDSPRVGDGVIVLDDEMRLRYASPNALSALHRLGVRSAPPGSALEVLGTEVQMLEEAYRCAMPSVGELDHPSGAAVLLRCLPLVAAGKVSGALLLVRDVSDLRRRDRLLVSKDVTIQEIHHRVKNNLQTISSLLRLQTRRLGSDEGREALVEAERRVRSIAIVHDFLSRDTSDQVAFGDIVEALLRMARESVMPGAEIALSCVGDPGQLPAGIATPLAVVVSELLQNAVEHAFGERAAGRVEVRMRNGGDSLEVVVADDGRGLPEDFDLERTRSLGLTIVRNLVRDQLGGSIALGGDAGLVATLLVPLQRNEALGE